MHTKTFRRFIIQLTAIALVAMAFPSSSRAITIDSLTRIAGADRFATSIATSQNHYPVAGSAETAVIASGRNFPDALSGVSLAALGDGPLLLTEPTYLPSTVAGELVRVLPSGSTIYLLGGEAAISSGVETSITNLGYTVQRVAGATRYGTSTNIAAEVDRLPGALPQTHLYIVSGSSFADALSVSPLAALNSQVIILSPKDHLSEEARAYLDATPSIVSATLIGGTAVTSDLLAAELEARGLSLDRIGGVDRYDTSRKIADVYVDGLVEPAGVGIASGQNYPDALSAGPDLAFKGFPLLLAQQNDIGCIETGDFLADYADRINSGYVYGGSAAVSTRTQEYAELLMSGNATTGNCSTPDVASSYPTCPSPFTVDFPTDISKVTSVLYPGQYRGGQYKPHGGFRFDTSHTGDISVSAPFDAQVYDGAHYTESGQSQYYFDFLNPCGIRYRVDHLLTLSPKFQGIADAYLPQNGESDSHSTEFPPVSISQGELIASAVGLVDNGITTENVFFDWGMYDLRQTNVISLDPAWSAVHPNDQEQHGVCVWDWLDASTRAQVLALPPGDMVSGSTSDYCSS